MEYLWKRLKSICLPDERMTCMERADIDLKLYPNIAWYVCGNKINDNMKIVCFNAACEPCKHKHRSKKCELNPDLIIAVKTNIYRPAHNLVEFFPLILGWSSVFHSASSCSTCLMVRRPCLRLMILSILWNETIFITRSYCTIIS